MLITGFYAGILGLMFVFLSARVILSRRENKTSLGDGGHPDLIRRIRVHGNFSEYVPIALILMAALDIAQTAPWILHALGCTLIAGRVLHALAITRDSINLRQAGMALTLTMIILASLHSIAYFVF